MMLAFLNERQVDGGLFATPIHSTSRPASPATFSGPEAELLLRAVQGDLESRNAEQIKSLLGGRINWAYLLQTADHHGAMPLLYRQLSEGYSDLVSRTMLDQLGDHFRNNIRSNFILSGQLCSLLKLFHANGITAIPFKGITLAACAYGNLALRDVGDLDLLVRNCDMVKATELLLGQGYQPMYKLGLRQEAAYRGSLGQLSFVSSHSAGVVDLHTALLPRDFFFPLDFDRVWERRVTLSFGGMDVPSLCPEDLLLVLCAHGGKHHWTYLKWICDIAHLIHRHPEMNWTLSEKRLTAWPVSACFFLACCWLRSSCKHLFRRKSGRGSRPMQRYNRSPRK